MINQIVLDLMKCFPNSFVNYNGEFIAHQKANEYFILKSCKNDFEVKCKVLEWFSRSAFKGVLYNQDKKNQEFRKFMLDGINNFLGTNFDKGDIELIYTVLGNEVNRSLTECFILNNYDMSTLRK